MRCAVYKSLKQLDYYLYVPCDQELDRLPEGLKQLLGGLQKVIELELDAGRKLAHADVLDVLRQMEQRGYYLQMAPGRAGDALSTQ